MNPKPSKNPRELTISRRSFIVGTVVGGTAAGMAVVTSTAVQDFLFRKLNQRPLLKRIAKEATSNRRSAFWTVVETLGTWIFNVAIGYFADRIGVDHGGHAADGDLYAEQLQESPVQLYLRDNIAIPVVEEAIFRLLPSAFFSDEVDPLNMRWGTGIASATLFAAVHNFSKPEADRITLHLDSIPVEQFVLGVYCWHAQRRGGFRHAAGAHVLYNNLCEAYWYLYESKAVEKQIRESGTAEKDGKPN